MRDTDTILIEILTRLNAAQQDAVTQARIRELASQLAAQAMRQEAGLKALGSAPSRAHSEGKTPHA